MNIKTLLALPILAILPLTAFSQPVDMTCTQHGPNSMTIRFVADDSNRTDPREIEIVGVNNISTWAVTVGGNVLNVPVQTNASPGEVPIKVGDTVIWKVANFRHGVVFRTEEQATDHFEFTPESLRNLSAQQVGPVNNRFAWGTRAAGPNTELARATVIKAPDSTASAESDDADLVGRIAASMSPSQQRRMLRFVNQAFTPDDLMRAPQDIRVKFEHGTSVHEDSSAGSAEYAGFSPEVAEVMIDQRPLNGYQDVRDCLSLYIDELDSVGEVLTSLGPEEFGEWQIVAETRDDGVEESIMHAAMLHSGKVLLLPSSTNTVLWDPTTNGVEILPGSQTGLSADLFCSGHSFLTDGRLLVTGGGGGSPGAETSNQGWKFDPVTETWSRTNNNMSFKRWYPTVVTLGNEPGRLLVASGWMENGNDPAPRMEIYSETTDRFELVTADPPAGDLEFRPTYPGLHLLPGGDIFHVPVGFEDCNQQPSRALADPSAIFSFSSASSGAWRTLGDNHRVKGMSVLLLDQVSPFVRALVVGGGDLGTSATAQTINLTSFTPTWDLAFPLLEARVHPNVVLLPDGTVFISGGMEAGQTPPPNGGRCELYDPRTGSIAEMDEMNRPRHYHSVAILLPTGEVMAAGGASQGGCSLSVHPSIEVFRPPYLFRGPRPTIDSAPAKVEHGASFTISTPEARDINRIVFARPMAVTHQTDSEQRMIPLAFNIEDDSTIMATAPGGMAPNSIAPRGHYMLFILNSDGVPSESAWIYLN